jgi:Zn-dependent peptidase ImmA (M78 family)
MWDDTFQQYAAAIDQLAAELLQSAAIRRPPVDAFAVAQALGVTVAIDANQRVRARYVRLQGHRQQSARPTILLRPDPRAERRQWAVAHEIGEHVAHRVFRLLGVDPEEISPRLREQVACQFAGRLLVPDQWLRRDGAVCRWNLLRLKSRYCTASHELIARRMLECSPPVIITVFDHGQVSWRRANLPGRVPGLSPLEARVWRRVHNSNRPAQKSKDHLHVQCWPVHEDGWRREILRTEVDLDDSWQ